MEEFWGTRFHQFPTCFCASSSFSILGEEINRMKLHQSCDWNVRETSYSIIFVSAVLAAMLVFTMKINWRYNESSTPGPWAPVK